MSNMQLTLHSHVVVKQNREMVELFGFESRNKYRIQDVQGAPIGFAAEQEKGLLGFLGRQFLGHWRTFRIQFFDNAKTPIMTAVHPFRLLFQRLEVYDSHQKLMGIIQQRFSILTKRFDVCDSSGLLLMTVNSPIWKIWTFPFIQKGQQVAVIQKKWAGLLTEGFLDKDNFKVEFNVPTLDENSRRIVLAAAIFIDLQYFEEKAG